jgi:large subunit ribosomal protein L29
MDFKEIKTKTEAELHRLLADHRDKLREARFKDASRQLKDVREIREIKKTIARVLTTLKKSVKKPVVKIRN